MAGKGLDIYFPEKYVRFLEKQENKSQTVQAALDSKYIKELAEIEKAIKDERSKVE